MYKSRHMDFGVCDFIFYISRRAGMILTGCMAASTYMLLIFQILLISGVTKGQLIIINTSVNATKGNDVILPVNFTPPAEYAVIEWKFGEITAGLWLINPSYKSLTYGYNITNTGSLVIYNSGTNNTGKYTVTLSMAGHVSDVQVFTLKVYDLLPEKPTCQLDSINNSILHFSCVWTGNNTQRPNLTFSGLDGDMTGISFVEQNVTNLDRVKGKKIICVGENDFQTGNCSIIPGSPSDFTYSKKVSYSPEMVTLVLHTTGNSSPPAKVQWFIGNKTLYSEGNYNISADTYQLTILNFTLQDEQESFIANCTNLYGTQYVDIVLSSSSLTTGQIIGIVVGTVLGALLLLILLILLVCCICRRKSKEQKTVYGQKTKSSAVANPQNPSSTLQRQATPVSRMTANNRVSITATGERPVSVASSFWDAESFNKNFNYEAENSSTQYGRHNNVAKNSLRTATTV